MTRDRQIQHRRFPVRHAIARYNTAVSLYDTRSPDTTPPFPCTTRDRQIQHRRFPVRHAIARYNTAVSLYDARSPDTTPPFPCTTRDRQIQHRPFPVLPVRSSDVAMTGSVPVSRRHSMQCGEERDVLALFADISVCLSAHV